MKCSIHLEREAIGTCVECGIAFCEECRVIINNKNYCKKCVETVVNKGKITDRNPTIAALLSFLIGGAGQIYNGQIGKGILIFLTAWLIIPWIYGIFDAYNTAKRIKSGDLVTEAAPGCLIAIMVIFVVMWVIVIIGLLSAIAIPNLLRARITANDSAAKSTVVGISTAIKLYEIDNGKYPVSEHDLVDATPPYYLKACDNQEINGYKYLLELNTNSYKIVAKPVSCGVSGRKVIVSENGGEIQEEECK